MTDIHKHVTQQSHVTSSDKLGEKVPCQEGKVHCLYYCIILCSEESLKRNYEIQLKILFSQKRGVYIVLYFISI